MPKYKVTTTDGSYIVTTEGAPAPASTFKPGGGDFRDPLQDKSPVGLALATNQNLMSNISDGAVDLVKGGAQLGYKVASSMGSPAKQMELPGTLYDAAKGLLTALPSSLQTFYKGRTNPNPNEASRQMAQGTSDFITQGAPAAMGVSDLVGAARGALDSMKAPPVSRDTINNLSTVIKGRGMAASGTAPQGSAITIHPLWKQGVHELGFSPEDVAVTEGAPQSDLHGDLYRGATRPKHIQLSGTSPDLISPEGHPVPLPIATADRMVEIADRPIRSTIDHYRSMLAPQAQASIAASLDMHAANASTVGDAPLSNAYKNLAEQVRGSDGTVGALDDFKVHANKETSRLFKMNPSGQSSASASPVFAWRTLGDEVRGNLYPFIESQGGPSLTRYGQIEAQAIHARDGVYNNWAQSAGAQASDSLVSYLDHVLGKSPTQTVVNPGTKAGMASRAFGGVPSTLADFNTRFKNSIGNMKGYRPPSPVSLPQMPPQPKGAPNWMNTPSGVGTPEISDLPPQPENLMQRLMEIKGKSAPAGHGPIPQSAVGAGMLTPEELSAIQKFLYGGGGK